MTDEARVNPADDAVITITRVLDAPRELVWQAWTDPEHLARWWGPKGFTVPFCEVDVRPGGAWRIDMRAPNGTVYPNKGVYLEVVEPERLAWTDVVDETNAPAWGDRPPPSSVTTVLFEEEDGKTRMTTITRLESVEDRNRMLEMGADKGWNQSLDRLADLLANR